jgi:hypothetical protein
VLHWACRSASLLLDYLGQYAPQTWRSPPDAAVCSLRTSDGQGGHRIRKDQSLAVDQHRSVPAVDGWGSRPPTRDRLQSVHSRTPVLLRCSVVLPPCHLGPGWKPRLGAGPVGDCRWNEEPVKVWAVIERVRPLRTFWLLVWGKQEERPSSSFQAGPQQDVLPRSGRFVPAPSVDLACGHALEHDSGTA